MSIPEDPLLAMHRSRRLGDVLAEAFDRLPVDPDDPCFTRPDQGEFERDSDLLGTETSLHLQRQGRCRSKLR